MMTFPIDFHIAGLVIDTHLVFEILAYLIGFKYYSSLRKKAPDKILDYHWRCIGGCDFFQVTWFFRTPCQQNTIYLLASKTIVGGILGEKTVGRKTFVR